MQILAAGKEEVGKYKEGNIKGKGGKANHTEDTGMRAGWGWGW